MMVKGEDFPELVLLHYDEARAIGEGEVLVVIIPKQGQRFFPEFFINVHSPDMLLLKHPGCKAFSHSVMNYTSFNDCDAAGVAGFELSTPRLAVVAAAG